ncbi:glycosyl transferase family 2 [Agromyces sp. Root81]|uniref:glycosyltransferase family 2 protein n=1 Tax=Agromyces sp. Root81 TaxID=1736601 RepID=UPI0006F23F8F|nr:glycosyltransferase family 2 protein [Agromyces sp. Root81]KRC60474.1 glycosyl transferase family 2 [Agromyces sp. Root81]
MGHRFQGTLIVMPAFNEQESVGDVVREVYEKLPGVACLVVDDGSRDDTVAQARAAGAAVASLPFNLGVGGAMRVGFKYALEHGYRNVVQIDADGQHNPEDAARLIDQLDRSDLVVGARFAGEGDYAVRGPRRWAMVVLASLLSKTAKTELSDATSGFRASGPRAVRLFAEHYPAEYLGDTVESLVIAARANCSISQVPVAMRPRAGGVPSHNPVKAAVFLARVGIAVAFAFLRPRVALTREATS